MYVSISTVDMGTTVVPINVEEFEILPINIMQPKNMPGYNITEKPAETLETAPSSLLELVNAQDIRQYAAHKSIADGIRNGVQPKLIYIIIESGGKAPKTAASAL
jgi:hypothetical protein